METKDNDKWIKRLEIAIKLIDILSHGKAYIEWADHTIVKIEKIETEAKVMK